MKKKNDNGMGELLGVLKTHPELVHALVFDHKRVRRLLKGKSARGLAIGVDARKNLLKRVKQAGDGGGVAVCLRGTNHLMGGQCPRRTRCPYGTRGPGPDCYSNTYR
jgi:hypothetical protein